MLTEFYRVILLLICVWAIHLKWSTGGDLSGSKLAPQSTTFNSCPSCDTDETAYYLLGRESDPAFALVNGYSLKASETALPKRDHDDHNTWSVIPFDGTHKDTLVDLTGGFDEASHLMAAISNLHKFNSDVSILVIGGESLTEEHIREASLIPKLRWLIVDSATISNEQIMKHLPGDGRIRLHRSQRLWILKLQKWNVGSETVVLRKTLGSEVPSVVSDAHRFQVVEISRQGRHYFLKGEQISDSLIGNVSSISSLEYLDLSESNITDKDIPKLDQLLNLKFLRLANTRLTGSTLVERQFQSLKKLDVSNLSDFRGVPHFAALEVLIAVDTTLARDLFAAKSMPKLRILDAPGTNLSTHDFEVLKSTKKLKKLVVGTQFRDNQILQEIALSGVKVTFQ